MLTIGICIIIAVMILVYPEAMSTAIQWTLILGVIGAVVIGFMALAE